MTRRALGGFSRALGVAVLLAVASNEASAGGLYRWVTPDGRVEIGTTPPPGVSAVPWSPAQPDPAPAASTPPAPAPSAAPAETPPPAQPRVVGRGPARRKPPAAVDRSDDECASLEPEARGLVNTVAAAQREIAGLEAKLEKLEASDVAFSQTDCRTRYGEAPDPDCRSRRFDRDAEIESSQKALEGAQAKLDEAEELARKAGVPPKCQ